MPNPQPISLSALNSRIARLIGGCGELQCVWVTAETSDVRVAGGHCYMELIEKDDSGRPIAKMRATIWASTFYKISSKFMHQTGQPFGSDIKVMVLVNANFHSVFGLSLNISDIDASYTMGDALRRRNEIIARLSREGILQMNRELPWPAVPQRVAVISAEGAAGYDDFINQLYTNKIHARFYCRLFPAILQGERCAASIIDALEQVAAQSEQWDCVVIIRGGGTTSDLAAFDDYDLAANIAQFPLPVIIGIGHERDVTVLDYVANMRVKTPTAAAAWLVSRTENMLGALQATAAALLQAVTDRLGGCHRQLSYISGQLPSAARSALLRAHSRLTNARVALANVADRRLAPLRHRLDSAAEALKVAASVAIDRAARDLDAREKLLAALSPEATLKRGFSITLCDGKALRSISQVMPGQKITTTLCDGSVESTVMHNEE